MTTKMEIAIEYLNVSMQMYLSQKSYWCAIHLAAAAWELLDRHLPEGNRTYEIAKRAQRQMHKLETGREATKDEVNQVLNGSKNAIKHMNDGELEVNIDSIFEARWYIDCALNCFEKLGLQKTPMVWAYQDRRNMELRFP